jgi:uncharacterized membrane-anchored protein
MGAILGIVMPLVVFGLLYLLISVSPSITTNKQIAKLLVMGIVPNGLMLRYYLVNLKADKTGRGIIFVTFILAIIFVIFNFS